MRSIQTLFQPEELRRHAFAVLGLALVVALAGRGIWASSLYFQADDSILHLYRTFALDQVLREGVVYPRWFPFLAYGYGYPIFNYYTILPTYLAESWHIVGLGFVEAVKLTYISFLVIAATGAYALGADLYRRDRFPQLGGLVVAVAYVFFPYFLTNLYVRGTNEILGAGLLPWLVWSLRRSVAKTSLGALALTSLLVALLIFGHSLTLVLAAPVLFAFILFETRSIPPEQRIKALVTAVCAVLVGVALGAVYWLPMVSEMGQVRVGNGLAAIDEVFRAHFLPLDKVIQPSLFYEYGQAPFQLALMPIALAVLTLLLAWLTKRDLFQLVLFFVIVALISAFAVTEPARAIWLAVPRATSIQFAWRIELIVGLGVAIAIGAFPLAVWQLASTRLDSRLGLVFQFITLIAISILLIVTAMWKLSPRELLMPRGEITPARLAQLEVFTQNAGTTTWGEYLPQGVQVSNFVGFKANAATSETHPQFNLIEYSPTRRAFSVSTLSPTTALLHAFYSPDWQARIDGVPATTYASTPLAMQTIDIPAGDHRVELSLTNTWPRWVGTVGTVVAALIVLASLALALRRRDSEAWIALVFLATLVFAFALPTGVALAARPAPVQPSSLDVTPAVRLIGLKLPNGVLQGEIWRFAQASPALHLTAYWHVRGGGLQNSPIAWRLVDDTGREQTKRAQIPRYGTAPQQTWLPNEIIQDDYDLPLAAVPSGQYTLQVAYGQDGAFLNVTKLWLERDGTPVEPAPYIANRIDARLGDQATLIGYSAVKPAAPGSRYAVDMQWKATRDIFENYTVFLQMLDVDGKIIAQQDGPPGEGLSPTTLWVPGEPVLERRNLDLPSELPPGRYRLVAGLYRFRDMVRLPVETAAGRSPDDQVELGFVKVPMPVLNPTPGHRLSIALGSSIRLIGYDFAVKDAGGNVMPTTNRDILTFPASDANSAQLTLYWQGLARTDTDYKVFLHIVDHSGKLVAQQDSLPGHGHYPTEIWDAGEKVVDSYTFPLNLPPGRYTILVGMYGAENGERLTAVDELGVELPDRQIRIAQLELVAPK